MNHNESPVSCRVWRDGALVEETVRKDEIIDALNDSDRLVWLDVVDAKPEALGSLIDALRLPATEIEDAFAPHERPKVSRHGDHLFFTTYATELAGRLADLEGDLGPGLAEALARSADLLRDDADLLDDLAAQATPDDDPADGVAVADLGDLAPALRSRVWRRLLLRAGAPAGDLTAGHVAACDRLVTDWHGQGPLHLPGDLRVRRDRDRVHIARAPGGQ